MILLEDDLASHPGLLKRAFLKNVSKAIVYLWSEYNLLVSYLCNVLQLVSFCGKNFKTDNVGIFST